MEQQSPGVGNEIQLTDAIAKLTEMEEVYAYLFDGDRYDTGEKLGFLIANIEQLSNGMI